MAEAVQAFNNGQYPSIRSCAAAYGLAESTLCGWLGHSQPHSVAHENQQLLSQYWGGVARLMDNRVRAAR